MIKSKTRVLVTGGAGFIGSYLVERLAKIGADVTVIDDFSTGRLDNLQGVLPKIRLILGDLENLLTSKQVLLDEYEFVFHLAANPYIPPSVENPAFDFRVNLHTTFAVLEALRQIPQPPRLVNVSSAAVYGNPVHLPIKEIDPTIPISPYGVSKLAGERYVAVYSQIYGIRANSLRFFSVYGPRQRKQVIFDLFRKLRHNPEHLEMLGDGSQTRDFIFVLDAVQALLIAATAAPGQGEVYNVASGTSYSITEVVAACCQVCNLVPDVVYTGNIRPGDAEKWVVDVSALRAIGFEPHTTLRAGLNAIREWYDANQR